MILFKQANDGGPARTRSGDLTGTDATPIQSNVNRIPLFDDETAHRGEAGGGDMGSGAR